jgi:hypothetical protein
MASAEGNPVMSPYKLLMITAWLLTASAIAGESAPKFTKQPTAVRTGKRVRIEFAVDRSTDVAVSIENAAGKVVRHLVAGVLGKNPPKPLRPGLSQSVEWDGKADWGKPAGSGPFKVRVTLGLDAKFDKVISSEPQTVGKLFGVAAGPDGTLYAASAVATHTVNWEGRQLTALSRGGSYQRTLVPLPSDVTREQLAYLGGGAVEVSGRLAPAVTDLAHHATTAFWPEHGAGMAVTRDGLLLVPQRSSVCAFPLGKKLPPGGYGGGAIKGARFGNDASLAVSSNGKYVYAAGLVTMARKKPPPVPAIYRVKLPARSSFEVFFGKPEKSGNDKTTVASPRGLAVDGKGHLLVADKLNDRVLVLSEKNAALVGSFKVEKPERLAVDAKTGAVYVLRRTGKRSTELVKYSGWKAAKVVATMSLKLKARLGVGAMTLDTSAGPPVLWVACYYQLLRIEDQGGKFGNAVRVGQGKSGPYGHLSFEDISVDRYRPDPEIYTRCGGGRTWSRYNESTGKKDTLTVKGGGHGLVPGPDGILYALQDSIWMLKYDHGGNLLTWEDPHTPEHEKEPEPKYVKRFKKDKRSVFVRVCMGYMAHTLGVRGDGHLFAFDRGSKLSHRSLKALYEFLPSGKKVNKPIIWSASDNVVGPKFDQAGNIYIAEHIKPLDDLLPKEYSKYVGPVKVGTRGGSAKRGRYVPLAIYGSMIKFSPKGGSIDFQYAKWKKPYSGQAKLDPSLKTMPAACYRSGGLQAAKITGATWMRMGISHVEFPYCNCENVRFDVDLFGRVWYPDLGRYRVGVMDTNGNDLTHFGGYGNADSTGPESQHPKPDIAFSWPLGVVTTDKYAYMGDALNRRLLRARLIYAAESTVEIR